MKIIVPAEKLAAAVNKHLVPALLRKDPAEIRRLLEEIKKDDFAQKLQV